MGTASERIRVSEAVKRELRKRMREGESYNDVLERLFSTDREFRSGFGRWSDETADRARDVREKGKTKSAERTHRGTEDS